MPRLRLNITSQLPTGVRPAALRRVIAAIDGRTDLPDHTGQINLKLIDDAAIRALNKDYSDKDSSTDVLSFSYIEDGQPPPGGELGDVAISFETAARQATTAGIGLEDEIGLLLAHGTLHVLGLDHATAAERAEFDRLQAAIMTAAALTYRDFKWLS